MIVNIQIDTEKDEQEKILSLVNYLYADVKNSTSQMKLDKPDNNKKDNNKDRKYYCNNKSCKKEVTKDVVAFCLYADKYGRTRFNGKVYCKACQEDKKL